jgi:hypothetical protein
MHLRLGKKVSYATDYGDPSLQDMVLLRIVDIVRYELCVYQAAGQDRAARAWGPRNVLWTPSTRSEYVLITYVSLFV